MTKVSVIVPVYNVEQYLTKCLESLVNQTLEDIEIIIVNDGSPDNSQAIIDEYVMRYPNKIKAFKKENGGVSSARNYGILKATGEYIGFVDSDDWVEYNMFEEMYEKAVSEDFDIVICDTKYIYDDKEEIVKCTYNNDLKSKDELKKSMLTIYPSAWNKIYKRELFNTGIEFKKGVWFEDVEFVYRLFPYITSVGNVHKPFYNYLQRQSSITKTFDDRLFNYIENWNGIIDFYKKNNLFDDYKKELEYCYVRYLFATFIKQATNYTSKVDYLKAVERAIENVESNFSNYRHNTYFYKSVKGLYLVLFNKKMAKILYKIYRLKNN